MTGHPPSSVPFDEPVMLYVQNLVERGRGVELAPGRMTVLAPVAADVPAFVRVQFHLPSAGELDVDAVIVESSEDAKHRFVYRIQFLHVDPDVERAIRRYMGGWTTSKLAPALTGRP